MVQPDRDVRPFQDVLIELGARLGLPGLTNEDGGAKYPGGYPDYIVNHERAPGIGRWPVGAARTATAEGKGAANPDQLEQYVENGASGATSSRPNERYFKHANKDYLEIAAAMGLIGAPNQIVLQIYVEAMQKFRLAARGPW